ncbi:ABC transporter substrate-binding protein [uncultured Dysosmobacter sp.]|uniref:ABC transporter substrate-binding protein n=1 Tax=uncultured Dysosmobacter sp. TaxID=2591384 RepID=UPI002609BB32|nr:ABC transporter substrate-binding protein [uncultured Dysosmobacter sp.]
MKKHLKKLLSLLFALSCLLSLTACGEKGNDGGGNQADGDTLNIAYIGPLTGEASAWGTPEANTLKVLVDEINEQGGIAGRKVVLSTYDNRGDNVETSNAAKKAIEVGGADVIIGCNASGATLALAGVCEQYKIPSVATCATNSKVTEDDSGNVREWTFRVCLADPALGNIMAKYAYEELNLRSVGILQEISSDYSVGISDNFIETFQSLGGKIVGTEAYTAGDVDFRAQMTALHQQNPDALFLPMTYKELALATVQARDLGMEELFLGPDCWMAEDIFDLAGGAITGSYFVCTVDGNDSQLDGFKAMYEEIYHEPCDGAGQNAYFAYDAFQVIKAAVEAADSTEPTAIRDALETVKDVQGLTCPITIRKDHKVVRSAIIFEVGAEKFEAIESYMVDYGD